MTEIIKVTDEKNLATVMKFNKDLDTAMIPFLPKFLADYHHPEPQIDDPYWQDIIKGEKAVSYLVFNDGNPIGMSIIEFKDKIAMIESLFIMKQYRSQGMGKKLIEQAKKEALERDCNLMFLNVLIDNTKAKKLYQESGFIDFRTSMVTKL
ncbi:MAG TPA: GNAT family N-acetyltransferase [Eubacteriales bacterium]|nr:GNAT family N-acetyltransferase [Eubacteriales bacterium]